MLAVVALVLTFGAEVRAAPLKVRVRGSAKLTAHASRDQLVEAGAPVNEVVLSGTLNDDAGQPLALQSVTARITREGDAHDPKVAEGLRGARGCDRSAPGGRPRGPTAWGVRVAGPPEAPDVVLVTDEEGRFCFRARLDPDRYKASLVYAPAAGSGLLVDGVERELVFDLTKQSLVLRFDPTPRVIAVDAPSVPLEVVAILDDDANPRVAPGLPLVLASEAEELARVETDASGRARFAVPGAKLGAPGPGELRVSFAGDGETSRAATTEEIERHVKVSLKVPAAERGELAAGVPEDGIPLLTEVASSLGPTSEGSVEARVGEVVVGTAPVERGIARLVVTFATQGTEAHVRLRYVPASPWYEPLGEPTVRVPLRGPSLLAKAPLLLAGVAVLAFFLLGRVTAQKNKAEPEPAEVKAEAADAKPRLEVVRPAERGQEGWTGRVVDAHEDHPVPGVRVWIERGTFDGRAVLASVETDGRGRFTLPGVGPRAGDESIVAEGRLHSRLVQDLPAPGEIVIALGQRRRVLLDKMVKWARRRGAPFDVKPEPTPGHVRRAAGADVQAAEWASAIEDAAFGPEEVDARAEQAVERLAPDDRASALARELRRRDRPPPENS